MTIKKNLLSISELSAAEIRELVRLGRQFKRDRLVNESKIFANKTAVLIFEKPSLRTRITFETAIHELGGHALTLTSDMIGIGTRETVGDIARNLERWAHLIVARTFKHATVTDLAKYSRTPVINALTDTSHPCQALAFAMTLDEHGGLDGKRKIVFIGDCNNVSRSLMRLSVKLGFDFTIACPVGYEPLPEYLESVNKTAQESGATITVVNDPALAVEGASAIYSDVWVSMGQESEAAERKARFNGFQVNSDLMARAPKDVLVSHCLPAHRGEEITSDVLDSANSIAFDEAENRLHIQKAVIVKLFS